MFKQLVLAGALALVLSASARAQSAGPIVSDYATMTASPVALPTRSLTNGVVVKSDTSNAGTIYVGGTADSANSAHWYPLAPGEAISYGVSNLGAVSAYGSNAGDILHFSGN